MSASPPCRKYATDSPKTVPSLLRTSRSVNLEEDILGRHSATFAYGEKTLNPSDLVLRAICWSLFGQDMRQSRALTPLCAQELEDEGLGPLAMLSLRLSNPAPVVPSKADLDQLMTLAGLKPTLEADAGQSSRDGPESP